MKTTNKVKTEKVYNDNNVEIGYKDENGTHYYNTPEARAYFTKMTGHKFKKE